MSRLYTVAATGILTIAAVFYFWHLGWPDVVTDESSYATRAIGLVDFDFGIEQPTPWQWVDEIPWWMRLSFHDHPPLVFLLQHASIRLFGENPVAIRLPSVIAGLASVFLVYLIGRRLYSPTAGLASAALFTFTVSHVWISRIGLQESILIALMLASFLAFLKGLERPRWLPIAGTLLGLAVLAKYTALVLVPIFATMALVRFSHSSSLRHAEYIYDRRYIRNALLTILLFLAVASPVIIYNIQLYRHFGHFDFQFSYLLGQDVQAWQARPGQEALGSYPERLRTFLPRLVESNSPYFLALASLGLAAILWEIIRHRSSVVRHSSLVTAFTWLLPFLVFIGPAHRFLAMLAPWLAIAAGYGATAVIGRIRKQTFQKLAIAAFAAFVAFESFYSYNSVIALNPAGSRPWTHSYLHRQAGSWGFNELNDYLSKELANKMPEIAITFEFPFAHKVLDTARARGADRGLEPVPWGIVYNDNINLSAQLWIFLRRITYQGWPVSSAETFLRGGGKEFFGDAGVKRVIFVNATEQALQDRTRLPAPEGDLMEADLKTRGIIPTEIKNPQSETAFRVYTFDLR